MLTDADLLITHMISQVGMVYTTSHLCLIIRKSWWFCTLRVSLIGLPQISSLALTAAATISRYELYICVLLPLGMKLWCCTRKWVLCSLCCSDGTIKEWEIKTMTCVRTLHDHTAAVKCVQVQRHATLPSVRYVADSRDWLTGRMCLAHICLPTLPLPLSLAYDGLH